MVKKSWISSGIVLIGSFFISIILIDSVDRWFDWLITVIATDLNFQIFTRGICYIIRCSMLVNYWLQLIIIIVRWDFCFITLRTSPVVEDPTYRLITIKTWVYRRKMLLTWQWRRKDVLIGEIFWIDEIVLNFMNELFLDFVILFMIL